MMADILERITGLEEQVDAIARMRSVPDIKALVREALEEHDGASADIETVLQQACTRHGLNPGGCAIDVVVAELDRLKTAKHRAAEHDDLEHTAWAEIHAKARSLFDDNAALTEELDRLKAENMALKASLLAVTSHPTAKEIGDGLRIAQLETENENLREENTDLQEAVFNDQTPEVERLKEENAELRKRLDEYAAQSPEKNPFVIQQLQAELRKRYGVVADKPKECADCGSPCDEHSEAAQENRVAAIHACSDCENLGHPCDEHTLAKGDDDKSAQSPDSFGEIVQSRANTFFLRRGRMPRGPQAVADIFVLADAQWPEPKGTARKRDATGGNRSMSNLSGLRKKTWPPLGEEYLKVTIMNLEDRIRQLERYLDALAISPPPEALWRDKDNSP